MNKISIAIFVICLVAYLPAIAQIPVTCKVTDEKGAGLPYATAYCTANSNAIAANGQGELTIEVGSRADTILFSMMGYISTKRTVEDITGADGLIPLDPQIFEIEDVVVTPGKPYNSLVNGRNSNVTMVGRPGRILLVKVLSKENVGNSLSAIVARAEKVSWADYGTQYMLRARVYSVGEDGLPSSDLLLETAKVEPRERAKELRVDVSSHDIEMPAGGLFVGFEWLPLEQTRINGRRAIPPVIATTKMEDEELTVTGSMNGEWEFFSMKDVPAIIDKHPRNAKIGVEFVK
jgi:hypothetical protein